MSYKNILSGFFCYLFILPICNKLKAQGQLKPCSIINLKGDTLTGFIEYYGWDNNPKKIKFRSTASSTETEYRPTEIREFHVNGEIYEAAIVQKETSPRSINYITQTDALRIEKDTSFLLLLIKGSKSLYYCKPDGEEHSLYIKQNNNIELLLYKKYSSIINGVTQIVERKDYITQLSEYLGDCSTVFGNISNIRYSKDHLLSMFKNYYKCIGSNESYIKNKEPIKAKFGIAGGPQLTNPVFKSNSETYNEVESSVFNKPVSFTGAVFVDLILPRTLTKWSIYNELAYSFYKVKGNLVTDQQNPAGETAFMYRLHFGYIKLYNMVKYRRPVAQSAFYFKAGLSNGYMIQPVENYKRKEQRYSMTIVTESDAIRSLKKYEIGAACSVGIQHKKLFGEIRYELSNGAAHISDLKTKVHRISLLAGFSF